MKRFVLILRKVAKFVFRLISSRLSSRGAAGTISKLLETKFVSKLLENAVTVLVPQWFLSGSFLHANPEHAAAAPLVRLDGHAQNVHDAFWPNFFFFVFFGR